LTDIFGFFGSKVGFFSAPVREFDWRWNGCHGCYGNVGQCSLLVCDTYVVVVVAIATPSGTGCSTSSSWQRSQQPACIWSKFSRWTLGRGWQYSVLYIFDVCST